MINNWRLGSGKNTRNYLHRTLRFEHCETRVMLATDADIVFVVDESFSDETGTVRSWLASIVDDLDASFQTNNVNVQYGLIGFGEQNVNSPFNLRYAHSQLVGGNLFTANVNDLIGSPTTGGILSLKNVGGDEDGWDAFEHVIAEYNFRNNAVPIIVFIQNDEGRIDHVGADISSTTRAGVFAALKSKNVILNSMVVGETIDTPPNYDWEPVFGVAGFGGRILGVESDAGDNVTDEIHRYHGYNSGMTTGDFDPATDTLAGSTSLYVQSSDSYITNATNTNDTYIQLAWDTGGAARESLASSTCG